MTKTEGTTWEPGLVLIQIDGLARRQLERAMKNGHLPFLAGLLRERSYDLHSLYSGLPSSTPAMTAELLYGVKCAVPSFSFYSRPTKTIFRMFDPRSARQVDQRLRAQAPPLLAGGSAYACIYTGGAEETHFCACTMGLDELLRRRYPLRLFILLLFSVYSLARVGVLLAIEFLLALFDCARGLIAGQDLWRELKFVPSRVAVSILMRELATIGAKIDVARGLPVIYLDLVGYDEQAHRRGPSSRFAHWSLKGIDKAIARIWKAALGSSQRDYDVWVFSDHGSEEMGRCVHQTGWTLQEAIVQIFGGTAKTYIGEHPPGTPSGGMHSPIAGRSSVRPRMTSWREGREPAVEPSEPVVAAMGPIGHIYVDRALGGGERERLAQSLVERAKIPMVTIVDGRDRVRVCRKDGLFVLPDDAALVFAPDHPFREEIVGDFMALCRHPDAGDFVLWGWDRFGTSCAFSLESGSHAGPGLEETHAFALLPRATPIETGAKGYLRPLDLRNAALRHLGRDISRLTLVPAHADGARTARVPIHEAQGRPGVRTSGAKSVGP